MNARHLVIPAVIAAAFAATPVLAANDTLRQDPNAPSAYQQDPAPVSVKADDKSISSQVEAAVANDNIKAKAKDGVVTAAFDVAAAATAQGRAYVNHTFTSHLALSASLQPFAGLESSSLCEYPVEPKAVSYDLTRDHLERDGDGMIRLPDAPGLGLVPDPATIARYLQQVEITVGDRVLYRTPEVPTMIDDNVTGAIA